VPAAIFEMTPNCRPSLGNTTFERHRSRFVSGRQIGRCFWFRELGLPELFGRHCSSRRMPQRRQLFVRHEKAALAETLPTSIASTLPKGARHLSEPGCGRRQLSQSRIDFE